MSIDEATMNGVLSYEASKMHLYSVDEFAEYFAKGLGKAYDMNDIRQVYRILPQSMIVGFLYG